MSGVKLRKFVSKKDEAKFYFVYIFISLFLAVSSGNIVVRIASEGRGISYGWIGGIVLSLLMAIYSTIKYKKASAKKNKDDIE